MNSERARQLLAQERLRIEQAIAARDGDDAQTADEQGEPGEMGSEELYEKELDTGLAGDLNEQLAALERAEARLAAGTYGLSVITGKRIPDERLEALPTTDHAVDE